jgi:group I intron endonuclease
MEYYIFDLSKVSKAQVRAFLNDKARTDLTGGIYLWVNQNNGHFYVGSTLNFYRRIAEYFTLKGAYGIILKALIKYGFDSFTLVLFFVPGITKDEVLRLEQYVLDTWKPEYNIQPFANSSVGRIMSEKSKAKLAAFRKGLKLSEETKAKISASLIGENNGRFNKGTPVYLYEVHTSEFELSATFHNRARASKVLGIPASTLFNYIKNQSS